MGVTRIENLFRMRDLLMNPYPQSPSFHRFFQQEISEEMDVVNAALETGKPWATATYQLNYNPNSDTYSLNVSDWGKVLYVVRVTGNQYIPFITVPFDDVNNQHYGTVWSNYSNTYGSFFQPDETPERMSFYRESVLNSEFKVKINPMPQEAWTYQITYIPGYIGTNDPLEAAIQLPEHAELVRLRGAMALLPSASWFEDETMNMNRRKELAQAFIYQLDRKEPLFRKYLKSIAIPKTIDLDPWNSWG